MNVSMRIKQFNRDILSSVYPGGEGIQLVRYVQCGRAKTDWNTPEVVHNATLRDSTGTVADSSDRMYSTYAFPECPRL
jgi:hypothetical protein